MPSTDNTAPTRPKAPVQDFVAVYAAKAASMTAYADDYRKMAASVEGTDSHAYLIGKVAEFEARAVQALAASDASR